MGNNGVLARLNSIDWFAHVGESIQTPRCRCISDWDEAFRCSGDDVSDWCSMEARLRLYNKLGSINYERFREWNDIARSFGLPVDQLMAKAMSVPGIPEFPAHAKTELRSQMLGALLEEAFDDVLRITLCREQVDLIVDGHFPCGWDVASADDFPEKATLLVY